MRFRIDNVTCRDREINEVYPLLNEFQYADGTIELDSVEDIARLSKELGYGLVVFGDTADSPAIDIYDIHKIYKD